MPLTRSAAKKRKVQETHHDLPSSHTHNGSRSKTNLQRSSNLLNGDNFTIDDNKNNNNNDNNSSNSRSPYTKLYRLLKKKSWQEMSSYLETVQGKQDARVGIPKESLWKKALWNDLVWDETKTLILHDAIERMIPLNVIQAIIKAYPEGAQKEDDCGRTPLHTLFSAEAQSSCSSSRRQVLVLQCLLDVYPNGPKHQNRNGYLPLHSACTEGKRVARDCLQKLIDAYPEGAKQLARRVEISESLENAIQHYLPMHFACMYDMRDINLDVLLKAYPKCLHQRTIKHNYSGCNYLGCTPIELFLDTCSRCDPYDWMDQTLRSSFLYLLQSTYPNGSHVDPQKFHTSFTKKSKKKGRIESREERNMYFRGDNNTFLMLHYVLLYNAPAEICQTVISYYEEHGKKEISLQKNVYGQLPIHCALETNNIKGAIALECFHANSVYDNFDDKKVLACHPVLYAPLSNVADNQGRLPLHVAIDKYGKYDDRQNRLILKYILHYKDAACQKMVLDSLCSDDDHHQLYPLQAYLLKLASIQDSNPMLGCGGNVSFCPLIVQFLVQNNQAAVEAACRCKRLRHHGYQMLVSKNQKLGVELYPFQLLCLVLSSDVRITYINFNPAENIQQSTSEEEISFHSNEEDEASFDTSSDESNSEFTDGREHSSQSLDEEVDYDENSNNMLDQRLVSTSREIEIKDKMECDIVGTLYIMLQAYPAAIG